MQTTILSCLANKIGEKKVPCTDDQYRTSFTSRGYALIKQHPKSPYWFAVYISPKAVSHLTDLPTAMELKIELSVIVISNPGLYNDQS